MLLSYYEPESKVTLGQAYYYASLIVVSNLLNLMLLHTYVFGVLHLGMKIRVATSALVYRKALRLNMSALAETSIGQMVNLISNDVSRFETTTNFLHNIWMAPLQTIVVTYLLNKSVGWTGMIGVFFLLLFVPFQVFMGKKASEYRFSTAIQTDERIRLMNEIISGIQVIKMYTWEKPFAKLVEFSRRKEIQEIRKISVIRAINMSFQLFANQVAIYLCIVTYVLTGNIPTARYVFVITSFYAVLRNAVTIFFPTGITQIAESRISMERVRSFLLHDELKYLTDQSSILCANLRSADMSVKTTIDVKMLPKQIPQNEEAGVLLKNVYAKWSGSGQDYCLKNINLEVRMNQLVAVVGPVGSGKSSLLHVLLNELPPENGKVNIRGKLSFASQEPWLFLGSIRQNILFGDKFDSSKYEEVVRICALKHDFKLFSYGDSTLVGNRGVTLSGGQKARISLARAVYRNADIYILDDPLSAVDAHVGKHIFDECITGYLKNKCVVLVTHQLQYLQNVQNICFLENGEVVKSGTYYELAISEIGFAKLLLTENENVKTSVPDNRKDKIKINEKEKNINETPALKKEGRASGKIGWILYKSYFLAAGRLWKIVLLFIAFVVAQLVTSICDYFLSFWTNIEQLRLKKTETDYIITNDFASGDYLNSSRSMDYTSEDFLKQRNITVVEPYLTEELCLIIYTCLVTLLIVLTISRSIVFYIFCMKASIRLHNEMFNKIMFATMRFFNTNPLGRILNRFSKDMGCIDETLPATLLDTLQIGLTVLVVSVLIGIVSPWMVLCTCVMLTVFYCMRKYFLQTSRDIKRLEAVTRSPMVSHLATSFQGLITIRAFGAQDILKREFDDFQNQNISANFMFLGANRTFGFWLDLHCYIYIGLVTMSFLLFQSETFGGNVGLGITQASVLAGLFQWGIRQWTELENQMTCVERVKEYADLKPETKQGSIQPLRKWPEHGKLKFDNMCLRYAPDEPYVLNNVTFTIQSKEKIGIVGRTGAGKSSLITALFRLTDVDGKIVIDNVDSKTVALGTLRSCISIIPQEPVLFAGRLRKNLDPFEEFSDESLWGALEDVQLKETVSDLLHGLESKVSEGGSNFSVGQRQLICLARAILRNNKILVLDEATANVDPRTDALIQETIRVKFANCTVLTIAHRLNTVMDYNKVLVMNDGKVAEFGNPYSLLQNKNGQFFALVSQSA